jgi:hypothetical protein
MKSASIRGAAPEAGHVERHKDCAYLGGLVAGRSYVARVDIPGA